jgi:hypothetical protein
MWDLVIKNINEITSFHIVASVSMQLFQDVRRRLKLHVGISDCMQITQSV